MPRCVIVQASDTPRLSRPARVLLGALLCLAACTSPSLQLQLDTAAEGATLRLPEGAHPGLVVRRSITLSGQGAATRLTELALEPGVTVGIENLSLPAGLEVPEDVSVTLARIEVGCEGAGLRVKGTLTAQDVTTTGCDWGLDVQGGAAVVIGGRWTGCRGGARVVDGELTATDASFQATQSQGAALFSARSTLALSQVALSGGEHGLLMRAGELTATGLKLHSSSQAGAALVATRVKLTDVQAEGPFALAALQISESSSFEVMGLVVREAGATGLLALRSTVALSEIEVSGARRDADGDFGHAVTLQDAQGSLHGLYASDLSGAAVYASDSEVQVRGLQGRALRTALVAMRAQVQMQGLSVDGLEGPAVYAADGAQVQLRQIELPHLSSLASCEGAVVTNRDGTNLCPL